MNVKGQALINSFGNLVYVAALWLLTVITTQILGYEAAGYLTLAMTIGNLSVAVQLYGVRAFQSSDVSFEYSANEYLFARLFTLVLGFIFGLTVCLVRGYNPTVLICIVLFMTLKSSEAFSDVLYGNIQRAGRLDIAGYCMFARGVLIIIIYGVLVWKTNNLNLSLLCAAISCVLLSGVVEMIMHRKIAVKDRDVVSIKKIFGIIKGCFPLFIASVVPIVITAYPRIVLEKYYGSKLLGFYGNVSTPSLLITTLAPVVLVALLPAYGVAFNNNDKRKIRKLWIMSITGCLAFGLIFFLVLLVLARPLLSFVYTEQILPYVIYIYPVTIAMMLYSFTMCNYTALIAIRKKTVIIVAALIALVVCLISSEFLIKIYSIEGAIAVLIITYLVQFVIQLVCFLIAVKGLGEKA